MKRINFEDRKIIENLLHQGFTKKLISERLRIHRGTLFRELKKCKESYNAEEAQGNTCVSKNKIDWNFIGRRFGLLTVEAYANSYNKRTWWHCKCDCGKYCIVSRRKMLDYCSPRRPLSCGCVAKQWGSKGYEIPNEERALRKFQDLIKFREIKNRCWIWTGYRQGGKIPKTSWKNKSMTVRKCMYLIMNGIEFEPNPVFTSCGNLYCFNPEHLTLNRPEKRQYYSESFD